MQSEKNNIQFVGSSSKSRQNDDQGSYMKNKDNMQETTEDRQVETIQKNLESLLGIIQKSTDKNNQLKEGVVEKE